MRTSGRPTASSRRWWSGVYGRKIPRRALPAATLRASAGSPRRRATRRTIGRSGPVEQAALDRADAGQRVGRGHVGDHDRERLGPAALAVAQRPDGRLVGRVAGEVVAAEALDGDDLPRAQVGGGRGQRVVGAGRRGGRGRAAGRRAGARRPGRRRARRGSGGSPGRRTRRRRPGTAGTARIVVWARSYGSSSMIVARGPQFVQFVNG